MKRQLAKTQGDLFSIPVAMPAATVQDSDKPVSAVAATEPASRRPVTEPGPTILGVAEITARLKGHLERAFGRVWVRGEVSGFRGPNARGHLYFSLKEKDAIMDVCMWASTAQRLKFSLRDGLEIVADGSIELYAPRGRYSLIAQRFEPVGEGVLALAFAQLKERLTAEGLMGERRRPPRPLPMIPRRIGVVTSRSGAALQDFLRILHRRHPRLSVLVCDARVQGEGAAADIARGVARLGRTDVDVIVVTRGGGSLEDLWAFNEEAVARAIYACPVPVVSAVGHEVDFTIADFVADVRAPTPSAAAELLAPVLSDLETNLAEQGGRLRRAVERYVLAFRSQLRASAAALSDPRHVFSAARRRLSDDADALGVLARTALRDAQKRLVLLRVALERQHPRERLGQSRSELLQMGERLRRFTVVLAQRRAHWGTLAARLSAMSPLAVLSRGYSVTFRADDGRLVRSAEDVLPGEEIRVRLCADTLEARVVAAKKGIP
ncbi:MAG: exodeoxyribonuclease VII large subunit [Myxococcaceae bacterium]